MSVNEEDPYAYLERDFTSEKFKIEVRGLPKYYGIGEFKKLLNEKYNLELCKVKLPKKGSDWLYVCFRSEESRQRAISVINGILWKNNKLTAHIAKPAPDPLIKRSLEEKATENNKRFKGENVDQYESAAEAVKFITTPLWNIPYRDQLELKQKEIRSVLMKAGQLMLKNNESLTKWMNMQKDLHDGLPCELQPIQSADVTEGYRNKCEFTVGKNKEGTETIIGFRLSSYTAGSTAVGPISDLPHIPEKMKTAIKILEEFVRNSKLVPFNPVDHTGHWKQVTARITRSNDLMIIIGIYPQKLTTEQLEELKDQLKTFFQEEKGKEAGVTSLYLQTIHKKTEKKEDGNRLHHISGAEYIEETLLDMKFRISPQAFFQVNTLGAEVLYKSAIDMANADQETAVIDVCCGTGTIGLSFSKHCAEVFGLEVVPEAIKDAKENAVKNGITNCEFFAGKAEDILLPVIRRTVKPKIIAVVDPPRAGLHQRALLTLRKAKKVNRIVYISCDPRAAMKNVIDLARPNSKQYHGSPFVPVKAVAVDMFPHTNHCELIMCLDRFSEETTIHESSTQENTA